MIRHLPGVAGVVLALIGSALMVQFPPPWKMVHFARKEVMQAIYQMSRRAWWGHAIEVSGFWIGAFCTVLGALMALIEFSEH